MNNTGKLAGRTAFITGASRGIGKAIALKLAKDGANVAIAAKTAIPHPKLQGTIYTACEEVEEAGGRGLACVVDVRDESQVRQAIKETVTKFGGIDILVNNASAISPTPTAATDMKRYDLMNNINTRGTFLVSKECLPFLQKSPHAHILNISPPLNMKPTWFKDNLAYTMAKYGMSMCVLGMHEEFRPYSIGVNALWPRTAIYTAAVEMLLGSDSAKYNRKPEIMADAAYAILSSDPKTVTGNFFVDDEVLKAEGITDFDQYCFDPSYRDQLIPDGFLDDVSILLPSKEGRPSFAKTRFQDTTIDELFRRFQTMISEKAVGEVQATFQFVILGENGGKWFVDLKNGKGACGRGETSEAADATLTMDNECFVDVLSGKKPPTVAFMTGKMKISGNMQKVLKLDKVMSSQKDKK